MNLSVIFAGGVGSRMRSRDIPKQFLVIHGEPIIVRTVRHFQEHPRVDSIVVVSNADWLDYCRDLLIRYGMDKVASVVTGGTTGQESIYHGLCEAERIAGSKRAVVLVHDGVRPLIDADIITRNIETVEATGSAITCAPAKETVLVRGDSGDVESIPNRSALELARAPQSFWLDELLAAHRDAIARGRNDYIDSASMMFERGVKLTPIEGPAENIKVTTPDDFFSLQAILNARENQQIYGL
jgi:2-C-methyl-D-erythritol 4-phosphate cytidylyltransferase